MTTRITIYAITTDDEWTDRDMEDALRARLEEVFAGPQNGPVEVKVLGVDFEEEAPEDTASRATGEVFP